MVEYMSYIEVCTNIVGRESCVADEAFIVALLLELVLYFLVFVAGHRIVLWIKKQSRK